MDQLGARQAGDLQPILVRLGRRLRLRDGWLLAQRSLWFASLAALLIQLVGRVRPVDRLWLWTLAPLLPWLLVVAARSLLQPLSPVRVARRVDAELGLKERLATALMLEGWKAGKPEGWKGGALGSTDQTPKLPNSHPSILPTFQPSLIMLQRQDALSSVRAIDPQRAFPLRWLRRPLLLTAVFLLATLVLAALPNPMDALLAERAAVAQAAEEQAERVEELRQEVEKAQELTPEAREELLRQLAELAQQLRANPGDREEALADLSRVEEALNQRLDPNADVRQAALEALAAQLQSLAEGETGEKADVSDAAQALEKLAEKLGEMDGAEREALAQSLAGMAARAAQSENGDLAQALAALAQAAQSGEGQAASQAAQSAAQALAQAQGELADQAALRQALAQLEEGRQALAQAGQGQGQAMAQGQGQGQGQGQSQGQGQGQGGQPGGGGGTKADTLPPFTGSGTAGRPQGEGQPGAIGELDQQIYVPWERRQGSGEELSISGGDSGQGETQVRVQKDPLPGTSGPALVPYHEVYNDYLDAANQTMERSYIPSGLKDYVREYFSSLEP
jgi:hypothetical protein